LVVVEGIESIRSKCLVVNEIHFNGIEDAADDVAIENDPIHNFEDNIDFIDPIISPDHVEEEVLQVDNIIKIYYNWQSQKAYHILVGQVKRQS
jgi:hypothetical protein